ncbi:PUA-like domain-containing protein [Mycena olivaceomarginata]|nr:PUA-like domain-containing protein [Mycena olivaceomarginata]
MVGGGDGGTGEGPRIIMQILAPPTILVLNGIGSDIIRELIRCSAETSSSISYWLFKASHIVNLEGKEIKFSVDDFEAVTTTPWNGVRHYEARNLIKEMKVGEKALFYHSNCKNPGIAAFAEVSREAYPDHTAWDCSHPYYDPESKQNDPKWFMVDLTFESRAQNFVPLTLLRFIADSSSASPPTGFEYLGDAGVSAIKGMDLVTNRGCLNVQRVSEAAWTAVQQLSSTGGWDLSPKKRSPRKTAAKTPADRPTRAAKTKAKASLQQAKGRGSREELEEKLVLRTTSSPRKRKAEGYEELPTTKRQKTTKSFRPLVVEQA